MPDPTPQAIAAVQAAAAKPIVVSATSSNQALDTTVLGSMAARRAALEKRRYHDLHAGHLDEDGLASIWVRYKLFSPDHFSDTWERRTKKKGDRWRTLAMAEGLVDACLGVYAYLVDPDAPDDPTRGQRLSLRVNDPYGEWTKFDTDLAAWLERPASSAAETCANFYVEDAWLLTAFNELTTLSGVQPGRLDEDFLGN